MKQDYALDIRHIGIGAGPVASTSNLVLALARHGLLIQLAVIFSGAFLFIVGISSLALYLFYVVFTGLVGLCLYLDRGSRQRLKAIWPYVAWIVIYSLWGLLVSPTISAALPEVVRMIARTLLFVGAVPIVLADRGLYRAFNWLVQLAVLVNCAIAAYQANDPSAIVWLSSLAGSAIDDPDTTRFGALWLNANEAAYAYLFGILISLGHRGWLTWAGRAAALIGILLAASRSGIYILLVCAAIYLAVQLWQARPSFGQLVLIVNGIAWLALAIFLAYQSGGGWLTDLDLPRLTVLTRAADPWEQGAAVGYARYQLTQTSLQGALSVPWYGAGIFTFSGVFGGVSDEVDVGSHNIYLVAWGELGPIGLALYLITLALGILFTLQAGLTHAWRLNALLFWVAFAMIGLAIHHQFVGVMYMVFVGLIYTYWTLDAAPAQSVGDHQAWSGSRDGSADRRRTRRRIG